MKKEIQVKCIKDVIMNHDGERAFTKGKTYNAIQDGGTIVATNDDQYDNHYIQDPTLSTEGWFDRHFEIVFAEKEGLPQYVKELLELERKELQEWVDDLDKQLEHRIELVKETEERLAKAKGKLEDVEKVLEA
jgi:hypothetical protein